MSISAVKEKSKQKTPASFPLRRMDYEFQDMPKYWCNDEPTFLITSQVYRRFFLKVNRTLSVQYAPYVEKLKTTHN